jgi:hypothetical protein
MLCLIIFHYGRNGPRRWREASTRFYFSVHRVGADDHADLHAGRLLRRALPPAQRRARRADRRFHAAGTDLVDYSRFWYSWSYFSGARWSTSKAAPPRDSTEVYVVAKQWMWKLEHAEGQREINELHVPVGRDVKLIMTSQDVIHSFFVPAFRMKQDVLPGRYTMAWFRATKPGTYHLFCAEYCGTQHSGMIGDIVVQEPAQYEAWMSGGSTGPLSATGEKLFAELGCVTCHRTDTQGRGPSLQGVFGKPVQLEDGRTVTADENYIRESILESRRKDREGIQARDAHVPGIGERRTTERAGRLREITGRSRPRHRNRTASAATQAVRTPQLKEVRWNEYGTAQSRNAPVERENYLNKRYGVGSWLTLPPTTSASRFCTCSRSRSSFSSAASSPCSSVSNCSPRQRPRPGRHLQQTLHHARHGHGFLLPDPLDPRGAGQLSGPADDRRQRPRLSPHQPAELVSLHHRRRS